MEQITGIEQKLYEQLRPKFNSPCSPNLTEELLQKHIIISEVKVEPCNLFDSIRFHYRQFVTKDKTRKWHVVSALFDSQKFPKLENCYSTASEAKEFFNSLKRDFCEMP